MSDLHLNNESRDLSSVSSLLPWSAEKVLSPWVPLALSRLTMGILKMTLPSTCDSVSTIIQRNTKSTSDPVLDRADEWATMPQTRTVHSSMTGRDLTKLRPVVLGLFFLYISAGNFIL